MTHISLNPHFNSLPESIQNIEKHVFLYKKMNYYISKRRYLEEQVAFCLDYEKKIELIKEIKETEENIRLLRIEVPTEKIEDLCFVIEAYMNLYRLTVSEVAKQSGVSKKVVREFLQSKAETEESKKFAIWAIQTFRLDANLYLHYL